MSISKRKVKRFCKEFKNIENYLEAVDSSEKWDCHHRLEETGLSRKDLINNGMYYNRPTSELIFLTHEAHVSLHNKEKILSDETKKKMSKNHADFSGSKNPAYKFICPIKLTYMYRKQKMSADAIAKELDVSRWTILNKLRELDISIRKR